MALLEVRNLSIHTGTDRTRKIVDDVSFSLEAGRVIALIGESGSGKTTLALSTLGYTKPGLEFGGGEILFEGRDILQFSRKQLRRLRGCEICYVAQSAAAAFDPSMRLLDQIVESAVLHGRFTLAQARANALELFRLVRLPNIETIGQRFPHEVSGGQLQRLMLVMALCARPKLLVLDEPTTALDVTTQISVLKSIKDAIAHTGTSAIFVSHDLAVVSQIADDILVLKNGRTCEINPVNTILQEPAHPYTRELLAAVPPINSPIPSKHAAYADDLLRVEGLVAGYGTARVVHGADMEIRRGEIVAVIGESGSGKSTMAKVIAGLAPQIEGRITLDDKELASGVVGRSRDQLRKIQYVPQMADTALNPRQSIRNILTRPIVFFKRAKGRDVGEKVSRLLRQMNMDGSFLARMPAQMSGGQKQRVNLARAMAAEPEILICDEVTSALDTVIADKTIRLLDELRHEAGVSIIFISHDISTVALLADRVIVLYGGWIVESGPKAEIIANPAHPYTQLLLLSAPELRPGWLEEASATDIAASDRQGADKGFGTQGCPFLHRCSYALPGTCDITMPGQTTIDTGHVTRCHVAAQNRLALA